MANFEKIRVDELVPEQLRETAKNLIDFLKVYYSETANPTTFIDFLTKNRDVDQLSDEKFLDALAQTVAAGVPDSAVVQKSFLLKRLVDYYNLKGTERSIIIFFQLFYDKVVTVYYPWKNVFETSAARYSENKSIRIKKKDGADLNDLIGKTIEQKNEFGLVLAQGKVKSFSVEQFDETLHILDFDVGTTAGLFVENEKIYFDNTEYGSAYKSLQEIEVISGGQGYEIGDILFLDFEPLASFKAKVVSTNSQGEILKFSIIERGSGTSNGLDEFKRNDSISYRIRKKDGTISNPTELNPPLQLNLKFSILITNPASAQEKNKSILSSNIVLQDGRYYNKFAYEINSNIPYESYRQAFGDLIHPAGYNVFNNLRIESVPPIDFRPRVSRVEIQSLLSQVFAPGGSNRDYSVYGDSPNNYSPDEKVNFSPFESVARDNYTFYQSPQDSNTFLIPIYGDSNTTPKMGYFLEDFVGHGPILRNLEVTNAGASLAGIYEPGADLSPQFINHINVRLNARKGGGTELTHANYSPIQPVKGKIYNYNYWYKGTHPRAIIMRDSTSPNAIWQVFSHNAGSTSLIDAGYSSPSILELPPTGNWKKSGSTSFTPSTSFSYGNIVSNDKFVTEFR